MSRINVHVVMAITEGSYTTREVTLANAHAANEVASRTSGEEIMAAAEILTQLDHLKDGEALVVWREID